MRQGSKLTAMAVRNATKPGLYGDGHGLYLQVSAFETKAWVFRYMVDGRARKMGLGPLHTISLAEARKRAAEARLRVHDGIDPIDDHKAQRARKRLEAAKAMTFKACADRYIEANREGWKNSKHADQWFSTFNATARGSLKFPAATDAINELPVAAIDTGLVLKVLEPIWTKTPEVGKPHPRAHRVRSWIGQRFADTGGAKTRLAGEAISTKHSRNVQERKPSSITLLCPILIWLRSWRRLARKMACRLVRLNSPS